MTTRSESPESHQLPDVAWQELEADDWRTAATLAHRVLSRTADAVFVLDVNTGRAAHRWYDREHSQLDLPATPGDHELVGWVHPDDLPIVLEAYAGVVNGGEMQTTFARINPERDASPGASLLILFRDVRDFADDGVLVQVWFLGPDSAIGPDPEKAASLSSLADAAPVGLQVISAAGRVSFENERFGRLADGDRDEIAGRVRTASKAGVPVSQDLVVADRALRLRVVPTLDTDGDLVLAVASLEDISRVQAAEARRAAAEEQFDALFLSSPLATALVNLEGVLVRANESFAIVTGYELDELVGKTFQEITHPDDLSADEELLTEVVAGTRQNYQMEKRYIHAAGHEVWVELTVAPVRDAGGSVRNFVAHVEDITSRRSMIDLGDSEDDLTYWATHDHLTALPNRRYLEHHLQTSLQRTRRESDRPVVMFLDLDDFKPVNDVHGHQAGDEVLRTIARRLRNACRDDAIVTRYGGDEFVVVARRLRTVADVPILTDRIQAAVRGAITLPGIDETVRVGVSVGVVVARDSESHEELLARADAAAYRAKREAKGEVRYESP